MKNLHRYIEEAQRFIAAVVRDMLVDGIKCTRMGPDILYARELFETEKLLLYPGWRQYLNLSILLYYKIILF